MDVLTEADRIKGRLRNCSSAADVETVAGEEREVVKEMGNIEGDGRTMAIQISNLKLYTLDRLKREGSQ